MALTDGILGCWSPSIRGSGYVLPDLTNRRNNGSLVNMNASEWTPQAVAGRSGVVLNYGDTATEKLVTLGKQLPSMAGSAELTLTMWSRRLAANGIANCGQAAGATYANVVPFADGNVYFQVSPNFVAFADNSTLWRFWCMTLSASTIRGYRDGVQVATTAGPATVPTVVADFVIGSYPPFATKANSQIGEVAAFNRALRATEILELYRAGNGAIGRILTGQTRRPVYGNGARFQAAWARGSNVLLGFNQP